MLKPMRMALAAMLGLAGVTGAARAETYQWDAVAMDGGGIVLLDPASVDGGPVQRIFVGVSRLDSAGANPHPTPPEAMNRSQVWEYDAVGGNWTNITPAGNGTFGKVALSSAGQVLPHAPSGSATAYRSTNFGGSWRTVAGQGVAAAHGFF